MTRRRDLARRIAAYTEIDGIMVAMKNLAFVETRRLAARLQTQGRAVATIEAAARDFLSFHGERLRPAPSPSPSVIRVLIGSERGFCGEFNQDLLAYAQALPAAEAGSSLVVVGTRLASRLRERGIAAAAFVDGPAVADEVQPALARLVQRLRELQRQQGAEASRGLAVVYHGDDGDSIIERELLPLPVTPPSLPLPPGRVFPPLLNLAPLDFFIQLTEQYLYAALHEVFYLSMMAENRRRLEHMERALRKLERDVGDLRLRYNRLRQEEIIEEIEVILLSAEALDPRAVH